MENGRPRLLCIVAGLLVMPVALVLGEEERSTDCSKWTIKGLRLGMTLQEVRAAHENLKHGRNWFRPDDQGRAWHFWAESRSKGLYNYVLPERDDPAAELVSLMVLVDVSQSSPSAVIDALIERWGEPLTREAPIATARYFNAFGAPRGEFEWLATSWQDPSCDILATLLDKTKLSPPTLLTAGLAFKEVTVSLDSISKLVERKELERERAKEVVPP